MINKKRIVLLGITSALLAAIAAPGGGRDTDPSAVRQAAASGGFNLTWHTVDGGAARIRGLPRDPICRRVPAGDGRLGGTC